MKIAIVSDGIYPYVIGGMQKHSYLLAKHLAENHSLVIYHFKNSKIEQADFDSYANAFTSNITLIEMPFEENVFLPGHYLRANFRYSRSVLNHLLSNQFPDIIICKGFTAFEIVKYRMRRTDFPLVCVNFHGYEMFQRSFTLKSKLIAGFLRYWVKFISRKADYCFSYGGKITKILEDKLCVSNDRILEFPSGIEDSKVLKELPKHEGEIKFCFVGRFERRKGIEELNVALLKIEKLDNWSFDFIGPIPDDLKISHPNIYYHGSINNENLIFSIMQKSDVLVCPSWSEGMPNVILEGMANGMAVLATDVGATSLLVDDSNGWVINYPKPLEIECALKKILLEERSTIDDKRHHSLCKVRENFVWSKIAEKLSDELINLKNHKASRKNFK